MNQSYAIKIYRNILNTEFSADDICGPLAFNECLNSWAWAAFVFFSEA